VLSHTRPPYHAEERSDITSMNKSSLRMRTQFLFTISVRTCSGGRRAYLHTLIRTCKIILDCIQKGRGNQLTFRKCATSETDSGQLSRYTDGLRAGQPEFDSRNRTNFLFPTASRSTLEPRLLANEYRGIFSGT
jgi:hypothetical protein